MKGRSGGNSRRGLGTRAMGGMLVMLLCFLVISFLYTYIMKPVLSGWEPVFVFLFGDLNGTWGGVPKFVGFLLFCAVATVVSAIIIDAVINSRHFGVLTRLLYKISFVKQVLSFFRDGSSAYRNLKQARSVLLRIGGIEIPAFVTKEKTFFVDGKKIAYFVLYCPHTPTFFTGNTFYLQKEKAEAELIVDVPRGELVEDVLSAGIFGVRDELHAHTATRNKFPS